MLGEGKLRSGLDRDGFKIEGKLGGIHPLTSYKIHKNKYGYSCGEGTLIELELWHIKYLP